MPQFRGSVPIPAALDQCVDRLAQSGLISSDEVQAAIEQFPDRRQVEGEQLACELVRRRLLTAYQVEQIYQGNGQGLSLDNYLVLDKLGRSIKPSIACCKRRGDWNTPMSRA